ncbi:unnamed protein product [Pipistrellus nathusii]|uniref:Uncharacterized protein n=1 Tax=Pipistrellus nathusii TaxID=59473 RepID=A0ABN9ZNQ5_PIPNA
MQARPSAKEPWLTQQPENRFQTQNLSEVLDPHALPSGPVTEGSADLRPRPLYPPLSLQASPCKQSLGRKGLSCLAPRRPQGRRFSSSVSGLRGRMAPQCQVTVT